MIASIARVRFDDLTDRGNEPLTKAQQERLTDLVRVRTTSRKPLAYLLNEAWLGGNRFYVDERTIVPRSFIAELLPTGIDPWLPARGVRKAMDLCTGSGCLAVLLAKRFRNAKITATDISDDALTVAARNVRRYRLSSRIRLTKSDLLDSIDSGYDLIVSNPPYVSSASMSHLPREYRYEPRLALAGGSSGLDFVLRILDQVPGKLRTDGVLVCEVGRGRAALERLRPRVPFVWLPAGGSDRYVFLISREDL